MLHFSFTEGDWKFARNSHMIYLTADKVALSEHRKPFLPPEPEPAMERDVVEAVVLRAIQRAATEREIVRIDDTALVAGEVLPLPCGRRHQVPPLAIEPCTVAFSAEVFAEQAGRSL